MNFEVNVGKIDRLFRVIFGILFIASGYSYIPEPALYVFIIIGAILIGEGLLGYCLVYQMTGITTVGHPVCDFPRKKEEPPKKEQILEPVEDVKPQVKKTRKKARKNK